MDNGLSIIKKFAGKKILIIGDVMLDTYLKGTVERVSAEAPIPIVNVEQEFHVLGGAGNVAANIVSLGGRATLFGFVGRDHSAHILRKICDKKNIEYSFQESERTIHKLRIIGNNQQLSRADFEIVKEKIFKKDFLQKLIKKAQEANMIIISDYAKGAITQQLMRALAPFRKKIIVDPKKNAKLYEGVFLIKPNEKEAFDMTGATTAEEAGKKLQSQLHANIILTRGKKGMTIFSDEITTIPTSAKEVFDVTGAGDTVSAVLAMALASGASLNEAAILANHAAGIKVEKAGTYAVNIHELQSKITQEESKILSIENLERVISDVKKKGRKIVWTNGVFDVLHIGHTNFLREAKKLGDILVVGLNSDASVKKIKGPTRPIQNERERAEIISSLECVDYVTIYPYETSENYLSIVKPHIYVKGGNFSVAMLQKDPEGKKVKQHGGEIKIIPLVDGKSTSQLLEKIKNK